MNTRHPLPLSDGPRVLARAAACALVAALGGCGGGGGGGTEPPPGGSWFDATSYSTSASASLGAPNELTATSTGQSTVNGTTVAWTAAAGHLVALNGVTSQQEASFFHVAYTADGADPATRPVTFFFNGGPGSASAWLHLGSFAPKRLDTGVPDNTFPRDFPYVDNAETLIDVSDLVFVDAVGTGLSEAVSPFTNNSFWGVDVDGAVVRDFIERWLAVHHRQSSPLYVFGESYGTVRAPVVVDYLVKDHVPVTGLILQSSILDYNSNCGVVGTQVSHVTCTGFIPSYGAVGAWLGLVQPAPTDLSSFLDSLSAYADSTYEPAVTAWLANHGTPPAGVVSTLAADTGLPAAQWNAHFNMDSDTFRHAIVPGSVAGLYDGRIVATVGSALDADDEPSDTLITQPFSKSIGTVLAGIGYTTPSTYVMLSGAINGWNFTHRGQGLPDVIPDLSEAMTLDAGMDVQLKVLSLNGVHDLITPYHQTELDLARLPADQAARVAFRRYPGGHMTYLDDDGRVGERADLGAFYAGTLPMGKAPLSTATAGARREAATSIARGAMAAAPAAPATLDAQPATRPVAVQAARGGWRDPGLPPLEARLAARRTPGESGAALQASVARSLRADFDRADTTHRGRVTAAQARAAGLRVLADAMPKIDRTGRGDVSFDEWMAHLKAQRQR